DYFCAIWHSSADAFF
nr:immunoglobulin light chain junction region [Macaca mulatta]MOX83726.1 immunoglobulin light chain junction region [Macaca mulatta]